MTEVAVPLQVCGRVSSLNNTPSYSELNRGYILGRNW